MAKTIAHLLVLNAGDPVPPEDIVAQAVASGEMLCSPRGRIGLGNEAVPSPQSPVERNQALARRELGLQAVAVGGRPLDGGVLGPAVAERLQRLLDAVGRRVLDRSGIETRHLAIDPATGDMTHTFCSLAEAAARVYAANGIRVYLFDSPRSTPELSFAIRHLNAISGCVFSASHNLPTDNGKKVYDQYGGQLIPPDDQFLVDEVSGNVTEIKVIDIDEAKENGLIDVIDEQVDDADFQLKFLKEMV